MIENAFVQCSCGMEHWGLFGAAGMLILDEHHTSVLLQLRSEIVHHKNTWSIPGGAIRDGESAMDAAIRETQEEIAVYPSSLQIHLSFKDTHENWFYETFIATSLEYLNTVILTEETSKLAWVKINEVQKFDLHPTFATAWRQIHPLIVRMLPPKL